MVVAVIRNQNAPKAKDKALSVVKRKRAESVLKGGSQAVQPDMGSRGQSLPRKAVDDNAERRQSKKAKVSTASASTMKPQPLQKEKTSTLFGTDR